MTALQHIAIECRQAREATARMIDWLDERRGVKREHDVLLRSDVGRTLNELARLSRAVERPSSIALIGGAGDQVERILSGLAGVERGALAQFQAGQTRLPPVAGLLPPPRFGHLKGASAVVRYSYNDAADAVSKSADVVGQLMPQPDESSRRISDGAVRLQVLSLVDIIEILGRACPGHP